MNGRWSGVWAEINGKALSRNVRTIRSFLSSSVDLMIVVKSNAYGHGLLPIAKAVVEEGANALCVTDLAEAVELREGGVRVPILLMASLDTVDGAHAAASLGIDVSCSTFRDVQLLQQTLGDSATCNVHLKIDTGMHRFGCCPADASALAHQIVSQTSTRLVAAYSQLSDASNAAEVSRQDNLFRETAAVIQESIGKVIRLHLANSAGVLAYPNVHHDMVRVGLAVYGLNPMHPDNTFAADLAPVLSLNTRVVHLTTASVGESVGYGKSFVATRPTRVAALGVGYACGLPRGASGRVSVLWMDQLLPQIGSLMMNCILIDSTDAPNLEVGNEVTLIGEHGQRRVTAWDWAQAAGSIPWEILSQLSPTIERVYRQ